MRWLVLIIFLLLISLVQANTTFFDNPDDVFIMSNPATGGVIEEVEGGGGCKYEWNCTSWSECLPSGKQTRNCTNIGTCLDTYKTPEIEQNCTYTAPEVEEYEGLENKTEELPFPLPGEKIINKNKIMICIIVVLVILSVIFYLRKDYFKKLIKK